MTGRDALRQLREAFLAQRLARALGRLRGTVLLMNTGAHPDDEHSALLAWARFGRGLRIGTLSATRGQGGQNRIGPARGALLGLLRSREMERAAEVLDAEHHWLDRGPGDPLTDFGFSKSGTDTLARWGGEAAVVARMVRFYRRTRPDIVLPTFLDVPGQHGHHRAMTHAALAALPLAADPAFEAGGLAPWRVAKAYLPAWSGGGATYDDEQPPPPATVLLRAEGAEPLTGASWTRIGEASRLCHASQDMGDPTASGPEVWPLHLCGGAAEGDILDGLSTRWGDLEGGPAALATLDAIIAALPNAAGPELARSLAEADGVLETARAGISPGFAAAHGHRLDWLRAALDHAILLAEGALPHLLRPAPPVAEAGEAVTLHPEPPTPGAIAVVLPPGLAADGPLGVAIAPDAAALPGFHESWSPLGGNGALFATVSLTTGGRRHSAALDLVPPLQILPARDRRMAGADLLRRNGVGTAGWRLDLPAGAALDLPPGLELDGNMLRCRGDLAEGRYDIGVSVGGQPAMQVEAVRTAEGEALHLVSPCRLRLLSLDLTLPSGRIACLRGTDDIPGALALKGVKAQVLEAVPPAEDFSGFDTIIVAAAGFGTVEGLPAAIPRLAAWVREGGNLVTLVQRPDQGWPAGGLGLDRLEIGIPSLRWRVTDPAAPVTVLAPGDALLSAPNPIGPADWEGWDKDRGLYFAAHWGAGYHPLLELADSGEAPLRGALLTGRFGAGRHTHCTLSLGHQITRLHPGALRLLANLLQPVHQRA